MNYENMSDFEINEAVTRLCLKNGNPGRKLVDFPSGGLYGYIAETGGKYFTGVTDYCNNPEYAWPIMEKADIGFHPVGWHEDGSKTWQAFWSADQLIIECESANPFRAAMIVYLLLQQDTE